MASWKTLGSVSFTLGLVVLCSCSEGSFSSMCSGGHLSVSSQVVATPPFDSVEIFINGEVVDSSGTPCATATTNECQTAYREVASTRGARFVTTRGNEVTIRKEVNLRDLGGTTDTPEEATLVVMGWSLETACTAFDKIEARAVGAGFEVAATRPYLPRQTCAADVRITTPVDSAGTRSEPVQTTTTSFGCDLNPLVPWGEPTSTDGRYSEEGAYPEEAYRREE